MLDPKLLDYQDLIKKLDFHDDFTYHFISLIDCLGELGIHHDNEVMEVVGILKELGYRSPDGDCLYAVHPSRRVMRVIK